MQRQFTSYSANREDVFLHRIFALKASGFYVDVGAAHPTFENDTKALYDRGWTGLNIEPNTKFYELLTHERPKDINLNLAIADRPGTLLYYEVIGTGLSTCDAEQAKKAHAKGFEVVTQTVKCATLQEIFRQNSVSEIDILKVDVEGYELAVLSSNDWNEVRPSVIIVEATYPETPERRPDEVAPFLSQHAYRRVYFDGLNDYFIAEEFALAPDVFDRPPNIFDRIIPYAEKLLENRATTAQALSQRLESELHSCHQKNLELLGQVSRLSPQHQQFEQVSMALARLEQELRESEKRNADLGKKLRETSSRLEEGEYLSHQLEGAKQELLRWRENYGKLSAQWDQAEYEFAQKKIFAANSRRKPRVFSNLIRAAKRPRHTIREFFSKR